MSERAPAPVLEIRVVNIVVADMAAAIGFYRRLGLEIKGDTNEAHLDVRLPNGVILAWDTQELQRSFDRTYGPPTGGYGLTVEFWYPDRRTVDDKYAELIQAGYRRRAAPADAAWGPRYALVEDPDGNVVALSSPLPATGEST